MNYVQERIKDLEIDMADAKKSLDDAEKEIVDAIKWRDKQLVYYAKSIIDLDKAKRELQEL